MDWLQMGEDAARGAAAGSVVPGIGTAVGAVGGVALDLAPELGQWLFGPGSANTVKAVQTAVQTVTGSADIGDQVQALTNPDLARTLRVQLASIAASRAADAAKAAQDQLVAQLADVANARATTVQLAAAGSPMAWGAAVVSVVVLAAFGSAMMMTLFRPIPQNAEPVLNVLLGSLTAMATSVVSYWVGSSVGSARKDARLGTLMAHSR
ncbi:MAG: hypothetical protein RQ966_09435 [Acetobacteraceae bacterium]|nr:hypothetical protein [Acetobacteraceae bacterium]